MSRAEGFKSSCGKGKKPEVESKREDYDKLYYRINKKSERSETNDLEWERSWKNAKVLKFPAKHAEELRLGQRAEYTVEQILARNVMQPEDDTAREFWLHGHWLVRRRRGEKSLICDRIDWHCHGLPRCCDDSFFISALWP